MKEKQDFEGVFSLGKNGVAFVKNKKNGETIEIPSHEGNTALHKDIVLVAITKPEQNEGKVLRVIERAHKGFVGILRELNGKFILEPDNFKIPHIEITNPPKDTKSVGNKVFVNITQYKPNLRGTMEADLGDPKSNDAIMKGIAREEGFNDAFPQEVLDEGEKLRAEKIGENEKKKRRDMRSVTTFTIDPQDAKDFDDALSIQRLKNNNYEIGIHIADVSHYVRMGSPIDIEAQERTTSVYLVDRTIPMLPEVLSNDLCSLRPNEERLAFSVVLEINPTSGKILNQWFGKTLIKSDKRFSYEETQEIIDKKRGDFVEELLALDALAKIYEKERYKDGSLDFETNEVKFVLDENGVPLKVALKKRIDTNKLIEEFMLLANRKVSEYMQKSPFFIYRVHDKPEPERVETLKEFLNILGYHPKLVDGIIEKKELQRIIKDAEGKAISDALQTVIVRSMQKAVYTTKNIGHFGLSFKFYSHFTSPIRRYPDVIAHRLLHAQLQHQELPYTQDWVEKICSKSSQQEQKAVNAERNSIKLKQVEYMAQKKASEIFSGVVTGASKFGVFVAEEKSLSEGMIRLFDLGDDFWEYKEKAGIIVGKKTKKIFKIGDIVKVKIKRIDIPKKLIDYELAKEKNQKTETKKFYEKK